LLKGKKSLKELFINRALENIKCAELAYENDLFNASSNRAYYAAFHISIAALYAIGVDPRTDHKAVQIMFSDNYFNRKKVLSSKYKGYLTELQRIRNIADYQNGVTKKDANTQLKKAKEFVEIILKVIK